MIRYRIHDDEFDLIRAEARLSARWDGGSNIRDRESKVSLLDVDNVVGQIGEWALSLALTGSADAWLRTRAKRARKPWEGDGGEDLDGLRWDVKSSLMRYAQDPYRYRLFVRSRELRDGWKYALALVSNDWRSVWLPGYATSDEVREGPRAWNGSQAGPHEIEVAKLHPMPSEIALG